MILSLVIAVLVSVCVGFAAGVLLSRVVINDTRKLEGKVHGAFQNVMKDVAAIHERINDVIAEANRDLTVN